MEYLSTNLLTIKQNVIICNFLKREYFFGSPGIAFSSPFGTLILVLGISAIMKKDSSSPKCEYIYDWYTDVYFDQYNRG